MPRRREDRRGVPARGHDAAPRPRISAARPSISKFVCAAMGARPCMPGLKRAAAMKLLIANKNYSSWSMRPWLAAKAPAFPSGGDHLAAPADTSSRIRALSPNGKVPALIDGEVVVFELIAILRISRRAGAAAVAGRAGARAHARSICAEMHAGFAGPAQPCPMNIKRRPSPFALESRTSRPTSTRIVEIWAECRAALRRRAASSCSAVSPMPTRCTRPVVNRFDVYAVPVPPSARSLYGGGQATPMWQEWQVAARWPRPSDRRHDPSPDDDARALTGRGLDPAPCHG